jgi:hypothetical protein
MPDGQQDDGAAIQPRRPLPPLPQALAVEVSDTPLYDEVCEANGIDPEQINSEVQNSLVAYRRAVTETFNGEQS